ncbi:MAG: UDP-N-acetylmuramate dehydrogenase [Firmicutes bacterium]|jgi:UDP-N-acetylmuramate dehydrogenase|nr:UDP-N-acetylmuramate dehydrogenase [Bacillota bacterium]
MEKYLNELTESLSSESIFLNELMKAHTSFKIGGPAEVLVIPKNVDEVRAAIKIAKKYEKEVFVTGNGSNLLFSDDGFKGMIIKIQDTFCDVEINDNKVRAGAGVLLSRLSKEIMQRELKGFEFASGIPGTLGGAVYMNAGAYGGEMKDVVSSVKAISMSGDIVELCTNELCFGYRKSAIQEKGYIVLEVEMEFEKGNYDEIKEVIDDLTVKRTTKQPLHLPSAGSTFKRPPNNFAGKLIQDAGLKGVRFGDAQVSDKHCGFVVNLGNATAKDVNTLIEFVQKVVYDKFDVKLETEVKIIGGQ